MYNHYNTKKYGDLIFALCSKAITEKNSSMFYLDARKLLLEVMWFNFTSHAIRFIHCTLEFLRLEQVATQSVELS